MTEATQTETTEPKADELEKRVDAAVRAAYRDGPEWMEVRAAVEALKIDRRKCISETPAETFERFAASVGRETEQFVTQLDAEVDRFAASAKTLVGEVKSALDRFIKRP